MAWCAVLLLGCSEGVGDGATSIFGSATVTMTADGSDMSADGSESGGQNDTTSTSTGTGTDGGPTDTTDSTDTTSSTATTDTADTTDTDAPVCGNGQIDQGEECDGQNLGGASCVDYGFDGGVLGCDPIVCVHDTSGCTDMPSNECDNFCNGCTCPSFECTMCCALQGKVDACGGGECGCF